MPELRLFVIRWSGSYNGSFRRFSSSMKLASSTLLTVHTRAATVRWRAMPVTLCLTRSLTTLFVILFCVPKKKRQLPVQQREGTHGVRRVSYCHVHVHACVVTRHLTTSTCTRFPGTSQRRVSGQTFARSRTCSATPHLLRASERSGLTSMRDAWCCGRISTSAPQPVQLHSTVPWTYATPCKSVPHACVSARRAMPNGWWYIACNTNL